MKKYIHTALKGTLTAIMLMVGISVWADNEVAQIGEQKYATLQAAINAAENGATISLIKDIDETVANTDNANRFTIDLGEHTWTYTQTENDFAALKQDKEGSVITLKNGTMVVSGTEGFNVWARNGKVIIESGTYTINSKEDYNIYTTSGYVEIHGGTFTNSNTEPYNHNASLKSLNLNVHNSLSTAANIKVYGGTFTADPSMGDDSAWGTSSFVANGYIVKTHEINPQTTYTVEPEVKVEVNLPGEASQTQKDAATALAGNTSVSVTTGLGDNGSLDVSITGVTLDTGNKVTSATFDVTPKDANGNTITTFSGTYTFRLPISAGIAVGKWVNLKHGETYIPASQVKAENANKFVTVTTTSFSPFSYYVLENPVAKIGEQLYETVAAAIGNASSTETTIELIANVTEASINIPASKNVKLVGGEHTVSGTITSSGTLTIVSGTYTNTTENALKIDGEGTITINAGVFSKQPAASMIAQTSEVMVGAEGKFVVAATGTAEAKIVTTVDEVETTTLYQTVALAIAAASTNETTITLLKNVAADEITIPENANITLVIADGVTLSKPITNSGTLTITSGAISGAITNTVSATMTISGGTFTGTITNNNETEGSLNITGGTFTNKPTGNYYCGDGKDLIINAEGKYVVTDITSAEAQIGYDKYMIIDKAITAAGETATTITLLKDLGENRSISIPENAKITLNVANEVTLTNDITITNNGALTIASSVIKSKVTIVRFEATVQIAAGVSLENTTITLSTELSQAKNVLKTKTDAETNITTYWVKKEFEATVDESITDQTQKEAADALVANSNISTVTGLKTNQSLTIKVTSVTLDASSNVTVATFDVKLIGADGETISSVADPGITFRLPIKSSVAANTWVNLWHNGDAILGSTVQVSDDNKYVAVSTTSFSPFSYEIIETPIAQIGETKYASVADAITAAPGESPAKATEITLLQSVSEAISVGDGKNVKLTIGSLTVSGTITNAGTLTIADGTVEGTDKTITNTGALIISGGNISNPVFATTGTLAISGGTIDNTITTTGTAGLNITGGIMDHAISIGGSGTSTISGGEFAEVLTATAGTLTISGGTFSKAGDNAIHADGGTINITGGTFNNTTEGAITPTSGSIHISGGTFNMAPVSSLCLAGYLPLKNDANKFDIKDRWDIVDDTNLSINPHLANAKTYGNYTVKTATYYRNTGMVSAGNAETKYGTICLPFEIKAAPTGMTLYKATSISGTTLTITPVTYESPISAGTPLIFELSAAASNMTVESTAGEGIAVNTTAPKTGPVAGNLLVGTYVQKTITSGLPGNIYYLNGDKFHQAMQSLTVPAFRAYLDTTEPVGGGGAKPMVLSIMKDGNENQTTGISAVEAFEGVTAVYDLNGRKQSGLQRGINIMRRADGSTIKVIVK